MSDTERDVSKALAAFGAPPLKYRSFTHAPILPPSEPEHAMVEPDAVDMPPPVNSAPPPPPPPPIGAASAAWDRMRPELDSYGEPLLPPPQVFVAEPPPPPPPTVTEQITDLPQVAPPPLPHVTIDPDAMTAASTLPDAMMPEMVAPEAMLATNEPGPHPISTPLSLQPVRLAAPGDLPLVDMFRILSARRPGQAAPTGSRLGA